MFGVHRPLPDVAVLPPSVDLSEECSPVDNQGRLGACTAHAIRAALEFDQLKQGLTLVRPSRLMIYYNERAMEGTTRTDSGAMIRDGIKTVAAQGACDENDWPYIISKFTRKPPASCYALALHHRATSYQAVAQDLTQLKACLAAGFPFVFGFSVYESFETAEVARTGDAPMPSGRLLGGHAVLAVGYDDATQRFKIKNSWGVDWGAQGYFTLPYAYLTTTGRRSLAADFWAINTVST